MPIIILVPSEREFGVRNKPDVPYWNVLVSDNMKLIDPEWPILHELMEWATARNSKDLVINFVMLLVHYMDSRFLNLERLTYVNSAVQALSETSRIADEALLRIDALGWTYVEESRWKEAHEQIDIGIMLANRLDNNNKTDLLALANAWKARALIEEEDQLKADHFIKVALSNVSLCSPWIRVRVYMAAGDIALKERHHEKALDYFEKALVSAGKYGGEGGGYQIDPRIGMALVKLRKVQEAEAKFHSVRELEGIPIGNLYGEYGLALVARERDQSDEAEMRVQLARQELQQRTTSNLLWKLLSNLQDELHANPQ